MRRQKSYQWMNMLVIGFFIMAISAISWVPRESWAAEEEYPKRLVQIVSGYTPGGQDLTVMPLTDRLPGYLGQPVAFVFKPGASGAVAGSFVAKAKPDGYTLLLSGLSTMIITPLTKKVDYTLDDFVPIICFAVSPVILAVKADSPWKTVKDIVEAAKKSPGKITFSTAGVLDSNHFPMIQFSEHARINIVHVPAAGTQPALAAALGGHVNMVASTMAGISPHLRSGLLRGIAVFDNERLKEFHNVPTMPESGYPIVFSTWYGLFAPKGTPAGVIKTFYAASKKVVEDHKNDIQNQLDKMSLKLVALNPEEYANKLKVENDHIKKIVENFQKQTK